MITETTTDILPTPEAYILPTPEAYKVLRNAMRWKKVSVKQARIAYRVMCPEQQQICKRQFTESHCKTLGIIYLTSVKEKKQKGK